jgi:N-acetylglutamate synthase-like GNAT family acetyltransferase
LLEQFIREAHKHETHTIQKLVQELVARGANLEKESAVS